MKYYIYTFGCTHCKGIFEKVVKIQKYDENSNTSIACSCTMCGRMADSVPVLDIMKNGTEVDKHGIKIGKVKKNA